MPIKSYKPVTPSRRYITTIDFSQLSKTKPKKALLASKTRKVGRDRSGTITVHHRGGGARKRYRIVTFDQPVQDIQGSIQSIEYDPNRTAFIAHLLFQNGQQQYILAPDGLKVGDTVVVSSKKIDIKPANRTQLQHIPEGIMIHNIEMQPDSRAGMVRSAGSSARIVSHEGRYTQVQLPSGEVRLFLSTCFASIGQVSNLDHSNMVIGKAGRSRWLGRRPTVRGKAKNPVDHPHGGGEGNQPIGLPQPRTPWGKPALGKITRKRNKLSNKYIIKRRKKK